MAITDDKTDRQTTTVAAIFAVRIPDAVGDDLMTDVERRVSRIDGVESVSIDAFRDLEPQLSATVVTVDLTVENTVYVDELCDRFTAAVCIDALEHLSQT